MASIGELFPELQRFQREDFRRIAVRKKTLAIAISPRTGSTWLCAEFAQRCRTGEIDEILNPRGPVQHAKAWRQGMSFTDYLASRVAASGDIFAFKAGWMDFSAVAKHAYALFPQLTIVYVDRRSIESQALSHYLALETGVWHVKGGTNTVQALPGQLDLAKIDRIIDRLQQEKDGWESFFQASGTKPLRLFYENFENDLEYGIAFLAEAAGLEPQSPCERVPAYQKLSLQHPQIWLQQILDHRSKSSASALKKSIFTNGQMR